MQPINICIFLLCIFALFHDGDTRRKGLLDVVTKCCQHAIKAAAKQKNPNCAAIGQQAERLVPGFICRSSAELCCVKQMQESYCNKGKSVAINGGSCAAGTALYGTGDQLECCYCCYLGIEAKRRKMGCRGSTVFGYPCQKAYLSCCLLPDPHPSGIPNIFGAVTPTTTTTTATRRACSSLGCSHSCVVLRGVPTCVCRSGFSLNRNARTCDDENECTRNGVCDQNEVCRNTYGSYQCIKNVQSSNVSCPNGLQVDPSGKQCQDIDECQGSPCQADEICVNTMGSYRCSPRCPTTYVYRNGRCEKACRRGTEYDGTRCVDIDECVKYRSSRLCGSRTCVNIPGSYRCVTPQAPSCSQGYELVDSACKDINECLRRPCPRNEPCINLPGSYQCNCPRGYARVGSKCQDVNECATSQNLCPRDELCENIEGSYRCVCPQGYERSGSRCFDIDECRKNLCRADETCINRPGTYRCEKRVSCRPGYRLVGRNCVDVNECENKRRCPADKECINTDGSYQCKVKCSPGYERDRIGDDCIDINECLVGTPCRSADEECQNFPGSYRCAKVARCQSGYERFNGKCRDKDECLVPNICRSPRPNCVNVPGSYRCEYNSCPRGFTRGRNGRCQDLDECSTGQDTCKARAERCINVQGTYLCRCNPGYIRTGRDEHCRDEDECRGYGQRCAHTCINTEGSFRCECRKGYALADQTNCIDTDECRQAGTCEHFCVNTQGSYYCVCRRGYTLHSNGASCIDLNECNQPERYGTCVYRCQNTPGSFRCSCPRGYRLYSSRYCSDNDECTNGNPCGEKEVCFNTNGGHKCVRTQCPNDHFIQRSLVQCTKKQCNVNDASCTREKRKSIRWIGRGLPNNARPGAFIYYYNITTRGYIKRPDIKYSIKKGNRGRAFEIQSPGYGMGVLRNRKVLKGPVEYEMEFVGEVVSEGVVTASFVNKVHVYVSRYDF